MITKKNFWQAFNMLQDTITYFGEDTSRRSVKGQGCYYMPPDPVKSAGCAIGRYLPDELCKSLDLKGSILTLYRYGEGGLLPEGGCYVIYYPTG